LKVPFIEFDYELKSFKNEYSSLLKKHIENSEFIGGESVKIFEENLSNYLDVEHVITVGNGTDALLIGLEALSLEKKEILVPSFSFFATSEAIVKAGLHPVFVDIRFSDCNIDTDKLEEKITENTGAILPVHLFGNSSEMNKILNISYKYNLRVIEDVAQAFGTKFNDKYLGTLGDIGCFSFFPTKTLGAYGDGGAIVTNNAKFASTSRMIKNHGAKEKYNNELFGYNSRLDSIQASILNLKLSKIDQWISKRIQAGKFYDKNFENIKEIQILQNKNSTFNYYSILIKNKQRDNLAQYLKDKDIENAVYYPKTLPSLPAHSINQSFPVSEQICNEILSLPIWPNISKDQLQYVVRTVKEFF